MNFFNIYLLFSCCYIHLTSSLTLTKPPLKPSENYTHYLNADNDEPNQYVVFWKFDDNEIQFEIHCRSRGWIGFGISPNGGMKGADIFIGWVDNSGNPHGKDCHATGNTKPIMDEKQDWNLLDAAEIDDYTILKFKRKLATCDVEDVEIKIGTMYMIFAWNDEDPITGKNDWKYHDENRRTLATLLLNFKEQSIDSQETLPPDTFTKEMRMPNVELPARDTFYYCKLFELPNYERNLHLIQYEVIVNKENKRFVHHFIVYECNDDFVPPMDSMLGRECGPVPVPPEIGRKCMSRTIIAWGIGGSIKYGFPPQAGYLIEPSAKPRYIFVEIHYDNPKEISGIEDNSGLKLYFTSKLRKYNLGLLALGTPVIQIPPQSKLIKFSSICYPECTERFLSEDGIYLTSGMLHTHLAGRSVKTTLVHNGKEIKPIFDNPNYDFEYQYTIDIEPTKLMQGDALITECTYSTTDRNKFTTFGYASNDEMCNNYVYYYPRIADFNLCQTIMPPKILTDFYRSLIKNGLIPKIDLNDDTFWQDLSDIIEFFYNNVTFTEHLVKQFEDIFGSREQNRSIYCGSSGNREKLYQKENVLDYIPSERYIETDKCRTSYSTKIAPSILLILLFTLIYIYKKTDLS